MRSERFTRAALLATGALWISLAPSAAIAQDYPNRPIRIVVGFPAGGGSDALARLVCAALSEKFGQQFVVDNKAGANTINK